MNDFYTKEKCDRCGGSLANGRIMSMFNEECIYMKCKEEERKRILSGAVSMVRKSVIMETILCL